MYLSQTQSRTTAIPYLLNATRSYGGNRPPRSWTRDDASKAGDSESLKILVIEDHDVVRKQVCRVLGSDPDFEVVCEAANGQEGIRQAEELQPDIILLDISMPTLGGIEAAIPIRRVAPKARIVFLSQHNSKRIAEMALATGALGYVVKSSAGADLVPAVKAAKEGKKFVSELDNSISRL